MRKFLACTITLILLLALTFNVPVFASSGTYDLDELQLHISIPDDYSVITRDTPASNPIFNDLGTTKSEVISQFQNSNIYLNAVSDSYNEEVVVTMTENSLSNFALLSDTVINTLASTLVNRYTDYGINVSKYEVYQHSQAKFVRLYFTDTDTTVHGLQYYTIYDGKAMNFTMRSYEGSISSRQEKALKTIVDSIKYDKAPPTVDQGEDTNSFIYTDTDSGVTFTVPANWKQEAFTKDRKFIDVKFVSTKEDGGTMIYGSTDMWGQMPASDKVGYTRSDINNSVFTKSDIAEMYSTTADKISTITYNGVQYFEGENKYTSDTYGFDITVTMTQLVYIDNGWMYMFQFSGTSTHKLYSDFESLLKSVQYPTISNVGGVGSLNNTDFETDNSNEDSTIALIVLFLIIAGIIVAAVIYTRKNKKEEQLPTSIILDEEQIIVSDENKKKYGNTKKCPNCGHDIPLESAFCHICGTNMDLKRG